MLHLCYLVVLLREITIHTYNRLRNLVFLRIRNRSSVCGFDWQKILKNGWGNGKKYPWGESGICAFLCEREKNNSFEITVIIFRAYKKCKSPVQKEFLKGLLTKTSSFLYFRDRAKNGEWNKGHVGSIYVQE